MTLNLKKGQKIDLTKGNPNLSKISVGLGWDINDLARGATFDLDASVFLLDKNGVARDEKDFIYFNNLTGGNGSVVHTGDNRTGDGDGDDELIEINLEKVPQEVERIVFTVTIYESGSKRQNFGMVSNAFIRVFDENSEHLYFDLGEDFSFETAVVAGELFRQNGEWRFSAIGSGHSGGLETLVSTYGLQA